MIDIRDHGGAYGGGVPKNKLMPLTDTNLVSQTKAILSIVSSEQHLSGMIMIYADDAIAIGYRSNNYIYIFDRVTGAVTRTIYLYSYNTSLAGILEATYDVTLDTVFLNVQLSSGYMYLAKFNLSTNTFNLISNSHTTSRFKIALAENFVVVTASTNEYRIYNKDFNNSTSSPIATIYNNGSDSFTSWIYDEVRKYLYLNGSSMITVLNMNDLSLATYYTQATLPNGMAIDFVDMVAYSASNSSFKVYDMKNRVTLKTLTVPHSVYLLTLDLDGNVLFANQVSVTVYKKDLDVFENIFIQQSQFFSLSTGLYDKENDALILCEAQNLYTGYSAFANLYRKFKLI